MEKQELLKELSLKYPYDIIVLYMDSLNNYKYWVYSTYAKAKVKYNQVLRSNLMDYKPCSLQITLLNY